MDEFENAPTIKLGQMFRYTIGSVLLVIGVALVLYVVLAVGNMINSDDPPKIIGQISSQVDQKIGKEVKKNPIADNVQVQQFDLAPDLKQAIYYCVVFSPAFSSRLDWLFACRSRWETATNRGERSNSKNCCEDPRGKLKRIAKNFETAVALA